MKKKRKRFYGKALELCWLRNLDSTIWVISVVATATSATTAMTSCIGSLSWRMHWDKQGERSRDIRVHSSSLGPLPIDETPVSKHARLNTQQQSHMVNSLILIPSYIPIHPPCSSHVISSSHALSSHSGLMNRWTCRQATRATRASASLAVIITSHCEIKYLLITIVHNLMHAL